MASCSRSQLDLSLTSPEPETEQASMNALAWRPHFVTSKGVITINDSVILDNEVVVGIARSLPTPKDMIVTDKKTENKAVDDTIALSIQGAASLANLGQRLWSKSQEVEMLTSQLAMLQKMLSEAHCRIQNLSKQKNEVIFNVIEEVQK